MAQFTIYLTGSNEGLPVEVPASCVSELQEMVGVSRFITGQLVDFPDADGVCANRAALIPVSRIQMIMEG